MTDQPPAAGLDIPAHTLPVPLSISPEAQAYLAAGPMLVPPDPALDDAEGWRAMIAAIDDMMVTRMRAAGLTEEGSTVREIPLSNAVVYEVTPPGLDPGDDRVYLDPHGGAFIVGGGEACRAYGIATARRLGLRVWAVDYRMPPDHPFPAAVDDCVDAYRALLEQRPADRVVLGGASAGANLVAALVLRARDEGLPLPAAAVLLTPGLDLASVGDTYRSHHFVDSVLGRRETTAPLLYAGGADLTDPYLSPLYGDVSAGFPPTLLASGTRDVLLSDTVRMHRALRAANIRADLHVLEAAPHGFFGGIAPEDRELDREVRGFVAEHAPPR